MVKYVLGKSASGDVANLQLQAVVLAGRVGQRKGAPPTVAQQHIHVLTGQILQALGSRQHQLQADDVVGELVFLCDPARQVAHHDFLLGVDLLDLYAEIGGGTRHAQKRERLRLVQGCQGFRSSMGILDPALEDAAFAGSAGAIAAAIGKGETLAKCRVQHALIRAGLQLVAAWLDVYAVAQTRLAQRSLPTAGTTAERTIGAGLICCRARQSTAPTSPDRAPLSTVLFPRYRARDLPRGSS